MTMSYDKARRMRNIKATRATTTLYDLSYSFVDGTVDTNRPEAVTDNVAATTATFQYSADRLNIVSNLYADNYDYDYDANGNLTKKAINSTSTFFAYDRNNQLICSDIVAGCDGGSGGTRYSHDMAGNLTSVNAPGTASDISFGYNAKNQTTSLTPPQVSGPVSMVYKAATQDEMTDIGDSRLAHSVLGLSAETDHSSGIPHTSYFLRDDQGTLVELRDKQGGSFNHYYYLFDGLGSVIGLTDDTGALVGNKLYRYDPYGKETQAPTLPSGVLNPFGFASGYMLDRVLPEATTPPVGKTNLIKFGTRYYMPELSRWTQPDPVATVADPMTLDRYLYVQDNPTTFTDPSGRLFPSAPGEQEDVQTPIGGDEYPNPDDGGESGGSGDGSGSQMDQLDCVAGQLNPANPEAPVGVIGAGAGIFYAGGLAGAWGIWGGLGVVSGVLTGGVGFALMGIGAYAMYEGGRMVAEAC
jgi:RHS repeat-associated protein